VGPKARVPDLETGPPANPLFRGGLDGELFSAVAAGSGLEFFDAFVQGVRDAVVAPDHCGMLVGGNRTHLEVVVQPFDGRVRKEGKKVPQLDLGDDSGGPHKRLGHHGPRKAHGGVEVSQKDKLGSHVVFQVHLEGGKQESSPPARFLFPTRPAAGSTNTALGIEKERHDVGVALAGYEKMAIEHFRQTGRGDVVPNRPIEVGLGSGAPHRSVRVLCLELLWADKAGNRGTRYHGAGDGDVWGADVVYQNGGCLFCGSSQRNATRPVPSFDKLLRTLCRRE